MKLSILVVDDSSLLRFSLIRMLHRTGFNVGVIRQASNGEEALVELWTGPVDIVLSDIDMPVMNGFEFLDAKNIDPSIRDIPVVMMSSETSGDRAQQVRDVLGLEIIQKPLTLQSIERAIRGAIANGCNALGKEKN
jgi:two-component system chemotaxis response regulator CheY